MSTRIIGRLGAAAALAVGLLIATSVPASATVHDVVIEAGSSIAIGTTTTTFGGHATTNVCADNSTAPSTIPVDLDSSGGGTVGSSTTGWGDFAAGTNNFKSRLVITGGTVSATTTTITITLTIRAEFRTCNSLTALCTTNNVSITLTGANDTGSLHPSASSQFAVSGTSGTVTTVIGCNTIIRSAIHGQTASVLLNLHLTT